MTRKRKFRDSLAQYKARKAEERIETERLREKLFNRLVRYAERLGEAELLRRLRIDYLDETERVERCEIVNGRIIMLGNQPLPEDHPRIREIDARLAELEAEDAAQQKTPAGEGGGS